MKNICFGPETAPYPSSVTCKARLSGQLTVKSEENVPKLNPTPDPKHDLIQNQALCSPKPFQLFNSQLSR